MIKGYYNGSCYIGLVDDHYMQFETESAYREYMNGWNYEIDSKNK